MGVSRLEQLRHNCVMKWKINHCGPRTMCYLGVQGVVNDGCRQIQCNSVAKNVTEIVTELKYTPLTISMAAPPRWHHVRDLRLGLAARRC